MLKHSQYFSKLRVCGEVGVDALLHPVCVGTGMQQARVAFVRPAACSHTDLRPCDSRPGALKASLLTGWDLRVRGPLAGRIRAPQGSARTIVSP